MLLLSMRPSNGQSRHGFLATPKGGESGFHFPSSIFHLRNLKNVEKAAISCVFEVYR